MLNAAAAKASAALLGICLAAVRNDDESKGAPVSEMDKGTAERLLGQIELAVGELSPKDHGNAELIRRIIESVNGLRSCLGIPRVH